MNPIICTVQSNSPLRSSINCERQQSPVQQKNNYLLSCVNGRRRLTTRLFLFLITFTRRSKQHTPRTQGRAQYVITGIRHKTSSCQQTTAIIPHHVLVPQTALSTSKTLATAQQTRFHCAGERRQSTSAVHRGPTTERARRTRRK